MVKAHFVNPPLVPLKAEPGQRIIVSAEIENIGVPKEHVIYATIWDSEADKVISRAEAFVVPGTITKFNLFFKMPKDRDLWVNIITGHYTDEWPNFKDDEVFGAKIENLGLKPKKPIPVLPLMIFAGIEVLAILTLLTIMVKRRKRKT